MLPSPQQPWPLGQSTWSVQHAWLPVQRPMISQLLLQDESQQVPGAQLSEP